MDITRRRLLFGLIAAPIVITTPGLLMPVKASPYADPMYAALMDVVRQCDGKPHILVVPESLIREAKKLVVSREQKVYLPTGRGATPERSFEASVATVDGEVVVGENGVVGGYDQSMSALHEVWRDIDPKIQAADKAVLFKAERTPWGERKYYDSIADVVSADKLAVDNFNAALTRPVWAEKRN